MRLFVRLVVAAVTLSTVPLAAQAQETGTIQGTVIDEVTRQPIAGVQVYLLGETAGGTLTNPEGTFMLRDVPVGEQGLRAELIGYGVREEVVTVRAGEVSIVELVIRQQAIELQGVIVTALGVEREKRSLGTSVQDVQGEELAEAAEINIVNSLSGRVAGVQTTNAGPAGGSARIVIRGATSIAGNNQPLFIVDGVPINNSAPQNYGYGGYGNETGGVDYGNAAQDINPNDIESVSVLKGPNAAALYGSRAANGAIVITTKSGKGAGDFQITASTGTTFEEPLRLPDYQNQYGQGLFGEFEFVDGAGAGTYDFVDESWGPPLDQDLCIPQFDTPEGQECSPWVSHPDNVASFFETGWTSNNSVALARSTDQTNVRVSLNRLDQNGMYPGQKLERTTMAVNAGAGLTDKLNVQASVNYINSQGENRPGTGYAASNPMQQFVWFGRQVDVEALRDYKLEDSDRCEGGTPYNWNYNYHANPFWIAMENCNADRRDRIIGNASASYQLLPWLEASVQSGTDWYRAGRQRNYAAGYIDFPAGAFQENEIFFQENNTQFLLRGNRDLNPDFDLDLTAGANYRTNTYEDAYTSVTQLTVPGIYNVSNAAVTPDMDSWFEAKKVYSVLGSAQLGFRDVVFLEGTARNDWSSTLPEENNSYFYPSIAASVIVSDIAGLSDIMYGKLRGGWARVGNDADPYQLRSVYTGYTPFDGRARFEVPDVLANAALKPEVTESWEIGTEMSFLRDRVGLDLTYYNSVTENQILRAQVSATSGFTSRVVNAGAVRNKGIEALLRLTPVDVGNFQWQITGNFADNQSEVEELYPGLSTYTLGGLTYWGVSAEAREGEPYGQLYGIGYLRDPAGNIVVDAKGLPLPDNSQRIALGNYNPDWMAGIRNRFTYRNFDFSFLFDHRQGGEIFSVTNMFGDYAGVLETSLRGREEAICLPGVLVEGSVVQTGTDAEGNPTYEANSERACPQDYFGQLYYLDEPHIYDATYTKLREMKLDWTVPESLVGRTPFSFIAVGIIGRNLALWTDTPNIDPETAFDASNRQGFEFGQLPSARTVGFNLTIRP